MKRMEIGRARGSGGIVLLTSGALANEDRICSSGGRATCCGFKVKHGGPHDEQVETDIKFRSLPALARTEYEFLIVSFD